MPTVTSIINLKGGVGKTTITLALAHFLTLEHHKRVLVIDLDPQTNATVCLIPEREWQRRDEAGSTLYQLFADAVKGTHRFDADAAIVRDVSNIAGGIKGLDLLPSSLRLIKVQDRVTQITDFETYERGPIFALRDALAEFLPYYDHILLDCPPSLGVVTLNGLAISDSYLVPVVPDILSVLGIPPSSTAWSTSPSAPAVTSARSASSSQRCAPRPSCIMRWSAACARTSSSGASRRSSAPSFPSPRASPRRQMCWPPSTPCNRSTATAGRWTS